MPKCTCGVIDIPHSKWCDCYGNKYRIGDYVADEDGNEGVVVIRWNDGDICWIENDSAHPNPTVTGNYKEME